MTGKSRGPRGQARAADPIFRLEIRKRWHPPDLAFSRLANPAFPDSILWARAEKDQTLEVFTHDNVDAHVRVYSMLGPSLLLHSD